MLQTINQESNRMTKRLFAVVVLLCTTTASLVAKDINLITCDKLDSRIRCEAKVRYSQSQQPATLWQTDDNEIRVEFDEPQRAITPGQAVVFYDGDTVIGGGTIV